MELIACRRCKKMMPNQMANCPSCGIPQKVGGDDMDGFLHYALMPLKKYTDFSGRARRKEFWLFSLFELIVLTLAQVILPLYFIASILLFLPTIAVGVRRLHDIDKSGWWLLLWFVPVIGGIILIVWACREGESGPNRFGSDPKEA